LNSDKKTPSDIQSINELITALSECERKSYNEIARAINIPISEFKEFSSWSDECYTRNCIHEEEKYELILLCWESGQKTPIHDHGGEECWVRIVKGKLEERLYRMDEQREFDMLKSAISQKNEITYMTDFMGFHSLKNISQKRSMSLHLYANPIKSCNVYDESKRELVNREMTYTTVPESLEN